MLSDSLGHDRVRQAAGGADLGENGRIAVGLRCSTAPLYVRRRELAMTITDTWQNRQSTAASPADK